MKLCNGVMNFKTDAKGSWGVKIINQLTDMKLQGKKEEPFSC